MKILKKMLAVFIASVITLSLLCVPAAAANNELAHNYDLSISKTYLAGVGNVNAVSIGPFSEEELEELESGAGTIFMSFRTETEELVFRITFNKGAYRLTGLFLNGELIEYEEILCGINTKDDKTFIAVFLKLGDLYDKFKNSVIYFWNIFGDNGDGKKMPLECGNNETSSWLYAKNTPNTYVIDISPFSFSKISKKTYTGKAIKPSVTVKAGDKKLKKGTDYTVSYKNNKKIGTATVTIKGKGDYTGEKTIEFKIVPKKTTLKVSKKSDTKATFSWTEVKGAEKYQIYVSKDGGKTYKLFKSVSGDKTSYTSTKLDFEKYDYKFKIRSYGTSDGKKYYSSYSKVKIVK